MASSFAHLEILGPRASLDEWLRCLQDHGGCHLADPLTELGGVAGIGRPHPTADERAAWTRRSEASHALRALDRFLPPTARDEDPSERPTWSVGRLGEGEADLEGWMEEASTLGGRIGASLQASRETEDEADAAEDLKLVLQALEAAGRERVEGRAWRVPHADPDGGRPGRLMRILRRRGIAVHAIEGRRGTVVIAPDLVAATSDVEDAAAAARAVAIELPDDAQGSSLAEVKAALVQNDQALHLRQEETRTALRRRLAEDGPRARVLVDALVDAEDRAEAWETLAATRHVSAARVFVRREDVASLARLLSVRFGTEVVLRELAPARHEPALPRAVAGLPFSAMDGLRPSRFGEVATASLLAVVVPILFGAVLADLAGGLLLLLVGGVIGAGAAVGSPRRDTALMAQLGGLAALLLGILEGRVFGSAGVQWFGEAWGLDPGGRLLPVLDAARGFVLRLGGVAFLFGLWGAHCSLRSLRDDRPARARAAAIGALVLLVVAGGSLLALPAAHALRWAWWIAPAATIGLFLVGGLRRGIGRLLLDLVGVFRLTAVALLALVLFEVAFGLLAEPSILRVLVAPALLLLATLALTIDSAYVAMGVPYDLSLGTRGLARPFTAFARRVVRAPGDPASEGARSGRVA